jgi:hypothetical protein
MAIGAIRAAQDADPQPGRALIRCHTEPRTGKPARSRQWHGAPGGAAGLQGGGNDEAIRRVALIAARVAIGAGPPAGCAEARGSCWAICSQAPPRWPNS